MITKIVGHAAMSAMMKKLRGGPSSMLPMSPLKGTGTPAGKGVTPLMKRGYAAQRQNPFLTPNTGATPRTRKVR